MTCESNPNDVYQPHCYCQRNNKQDGENTKQNVSLGELVDDSQYAVEKVDTGNEKQQFDDQRLAVYGFD